jgi:hypothetical protein
VGTSYPEEEECDPSAVMARVRKKIHKYGIEVPTSLVRAKELNRMNCYVDGCSQVGDAKFMSCLLGS